MALNESSDAHSSIVVDLVRNVDNERMSDFILLSLDGERVATSKFILGARSPVFQRQLFSNKPQGRSSGQNLLEVGYSGPVVRGLVEYCRSDDIANFVGRLQYENNVRDLVHLFACADFYDIPGLRQKVCTTASAICKRYRNFAPAIFDQACQSGTQQVERIALAAIQEDPHTALLSSNMEELDFGVPTTPPGVSYLSNEALSLILQDKKMCCDEIVLFEVLTVWVSSRQKGNDHESTSYWGDCDPSLDDHSLFDPTSRHPKKDMNSPDEVGKKLVQYIDLAKIAPSDLLSQVAKSGLVSHERITEALGEIAQLVEKDGAFKLSRPRHNAAGGGNSTAFQRQSFLFPSSNNEKQQYKRSRAPQRSSPGRSHHAATPATRTANRRTVSDLAMRDVAEELQNVSFDDIEIDTHSSESNSIARREVEIIKPKKRSKSTSRVSSERPVRRAGLLKRSVLFMADKADAVCASACNSGPKLNKKHNEKR